MRRRLRPSPAAAIALLALFISLGGTTYAVTSLPSNSVGTAQLRDRAVTEDELANRAVIGRKLATGAVVPRTIPPASITGSRIAPDALGGAQVDESLLGMVPLAKNAERAKLADRASTADRVERASRADLADRAVEADSAALAEKAKQADRADLAELANVADLSRVAEALESVSIEGRAIVIPETNDAREFPILCPEGELPTGGGFIRSEDGPDNVYLSSSGPFANDDGDLGWVVAVINFEDTGEPATGVVFVHCVQVEGP